MINLEAMCNYKIKLYILSSSTGPPFVRPLSNVTAIDGSDVTIHCHVVGYPIDIITWYKGVTTLPSSIRHTLFPNGTLLIRGVQSIQDEGEYTCVASNEFGKRSAAKMHLKVKGKHEVNGLQCKQKLLIFYFFRCKNVIRSMVILVLIRERIFKLT